MQMQKQTTEAPHSKNPKVKPQVPEKSLGLRMLRAFKNQLHI